MTPSSVFSQDLGATAATSAHTYTVNSAITGNCSFLPPAGPRSLNIASGSLSCQSDGRASNATFNVSAAANAPNGTQLTSLHTSAQVAIAAGSPGSTAIDQADAGAGFRDILSMLAKPDHMQIDFALSGTFDVQAGGDFNIFSSESYATVGVTVQAQSGEYVQSPLFFGSVQPFGQGLTSLTSTLVDPRVGPTTTRFDDAANSPSFNFALIGPGQYRLTLGPSFFDDVNKSVFLDLELAASARLVPVVVPGSGMSATADFSNTLKLLDVMAFDADGHDITADAFGGFASEQLVVAPPVPEPATSALIVVGLLGFVARRRMPILATRSNAELGRVPLRVGTSSHQML
jgi:hypothetical protein